MFFLGPVCLFCVFDVFHDFSLVCYELTVTNASDCLERLISKMTNYVSSGTINSFHSLSHFHCMVFFVLCCNISLYFSVLL